MFAMTESPSANFQSGPIKSTGRDLDIAIKDQGWIAVQAADGSEAYTRSGSLSFDTTGLLRNDRGNPVMGDNGPIVLPLPIDKIQIATDGTISIRPQAQPPR